MASGTIDVHQHFWPAELVEALRRRSSAPRLDGWTLHLDGEAPYQVEPAAHDVNARRAAEPRERELVLLSLSAPLGIEVLPPEEGNPLLDAWHAGVQALPARYAAWASTSAIEPDLVHLDAQLADGFIGLQVPATSMATPRALERLAPSLDVCERRGRPVLVHPGPASARSSAPGIPGWWVPLVDYVAQLQAAWWAWHLDGRSLLPDLRICFVAGAGLAPVHHERLAARGGRLGPQDRNVFVDTSSYGPQALDALIRALGIDVLVLGSDRPYAEPVDGDSLGMGAAAVNAIEATNPRRLLEGGTT